MSLYIDVNTVSEVLLGDEWHGVIPGTFDLDSYEFGDGPLSDDSFTLHGGGNSGICATGFRFQGYAVRGFGGAPSKPGGWIAGPLSTIQAVSYSRDSPA